MFEFHLSRMKETVMGRKPFQFIEADVRECLAAIRDFWIIEYGSARACRQWQAVQLVNLLEHARAHSQFWRARMPSRRAMFDTLKFIKPLTRDMLATQISTEGPLMKEPDGRASKTYSTTGSTGRPVTVYVMDFNGKYNMNRTLAEYVFHNRSFEYNRVKLEGNETTNGEVKVKDYPAWAGPLSKMFPNGTYREISYGEDEERVIAELAKREVGYLRCRNNTMERLIDAAGIDVLTRLGVRAWIHLSDAYDPELVEKLASIGIDTYSSYSSAEIGPIGFSCLQNKGHYHVATSNVIVETDDSINTEVNGVKLSRLLITGIHSYATPLIRYDIGDFGRLQQSCTCGHHGPTLSHIYGREKSFVLHPDGRHLPFYGRGHEILKNLEFDDSRIRQTSLTQIEIELANCNNFNSELAEKVKARLVRSLGEGFNITFKFVAKIDWSDSPKRLFFTSFAKA